MFKIFKSTFFFTSLKNLLKKIYIRYFYTLDISKININILFYPKSTKSEIYRDTLFNLIKKKYNFKIKKVLDFGCGLGTNVNFLFENFRNIDYYAFDKDNVSIEYLNCLNNLIYKKKINYINKDQVFKTKENFFDLIILDAVAMYFSKKEIFQYFNILSRISSKCILVHDLNHFSDEILIKKEGRYITNYTKLFQKIDKNLKLTIEKSEKPGSPWNKYGYKILIEKYQTMLGRK